MSFVDDLVRSCIVGPDEEGRSVIGYQSVVNAIILTLERAAMEVDAYAELNDSFASRFDKAGYEVLRAKALLLANEERHIASLIRALKKTGATSAAPII